MASHLWVPSAAELLRLQDQWVCFHSILAYRYSAMHRVCVMWWAWGICLWLTWAEEMLVALYLEGQSQADCWVHWQNCLQGGQNYVTRRSCVLGLEYSRLYSELVGEWDLYSFCSLGDSALSFGTQQAYPLMC